jgi:hypothetical protein
VILCGEEAEKNASVLLERCPHATYLVTFGDRHLDFDAAGGNLDITAVVPDFWTRWLDVTARNS